ncbi:unnamed protein product [Hyaloperonospora brassicae]|uniref:Cysteine-rich protein n=1 Tax=Hyaloperonospora brassicae TaxID=162125 RepID=A0AAV0TXN7_HYABA|nr:unnamed protein product [Hyaloperonospora brassicae]
MRHVQLLTFAAALSIVECLQRSAVQSTTGITPSSAAQPHIKYYVHVVRDGEGCSFAGPTVPMCANKDAVCRMPPGQNAFAKDPLCLPYDPSDMESNPFEIEDTAVAPWAACNAAAELHRTVGDPPVCKRNFQCLCLHGPGERCVCAPADAVGDVDGALTCDSTTSAACREDTYCRYLHAGGMGCGQRPYFT